MVRKIPPAKMMTYVYASMISNVFQSQISRMEMKKVQTFILPRNRLRRPWNRCSNSWVEWLRERSMLEQERFRQSCLCHCWRRRSVWSLSRCGKLWGWFTYRELILMCVSPEDVWRYYSTTSLFSVNAERTGNDMGRIPVHTIERASAMVQCWEIDDVTHIW